MKITESNLRGIIRQVIKESNSQENLRREKKLFTDVFIKKKTKKDRAALKNILINTSVKISDLWGNSDHPFDSYRADLFDSGKQRSINAVWSHDEMGECGFILVKAVPHKAKASYATALYAIFRVEVDASKKMFYLDIKAFSESPKDILNKFSAYK